MPTFSPRKMLHVASSMRTCGPRRRRTSESVSTEPLCPVVADGYGVLRVAPEGRPRRRLSLQQGEQLLGLERLAEEPPLGGMTAVAAQELELTDGLDALGDD